MSNDDKMRALSVSAAITDEEEKRRFSNSLGYRLGGLLGMLCTIAGTFFATGIIVFASVISVKPGSSADTMSFIITVILAMIVATLILPWVFLRRKYALRTAGILLAGYVVLVLAVLAAFSLTPS